MPTWEVTHPITGQVTLVTQDDPPRNASLTDRAHGFPPGTPVLLFASGGWTTHRQVEYIVVTQTQPHVTLAEGSDVMLLEEILEHFGWVAQRHSTGGDTLS